MGEKLKASWAFLNTDIDPYWAAFKVKYGMWIHTHPRLHDFVRMTAVFTISGTFDAWTSPVFDWTEFLHTGIGAVILGAIYKSFQMNVAPSALSTTTTTVDQTVEVKAL